MSVKTNFLAEAKIGKTVEIMIGTKEIRGTVVAVDLDSVQVQRENGQNATVALDMISFYEFGNPEESAGMEQAQSPEGAEKPPTGEAEAAKDRVAVSAAAGEKARPQLVSANDSLLEKLAARGVKYFSKMSVPSVRGYREFAMEREGHVGASELLAVADSLDYAMLKLHETSPADYKIQENITKLKRLMRLSARKENAKAAANMLAALYGQCKCEKLALDVYSKENGDNVSAFAVAESIRQEEAMLLFACRHFMNDSRLRPYIVYYLLRSMIANADYSLLTKLNVREATGGNVHGWLALLKGVLLSCGLAYPEETDGTASPEALQQLLRLFYAQNIKTNTGMLGYLPAVHKQEKPTVECPTYMKAREAREEKRFQAAEDLFIEAIRRKERPGGAAADLVSLMMQRHLWDRAAKYLEQYGALYMREEAYENMKKQIAVVLPRYPKSVSRNETKGEIDYFLLAQKTDIEDKDPQRAITFYKEAIKQRQRLASSVPNLASLYARLQMYAEALALLDEHGERAMERKAYLNLRISILFKAKKPAYKQDILDTYAALLGMTASGEKKAELYFSEAYLFSQIGEYRETIRFFTQCLQRIEGGFYQDEERRQRQKLNALMGICKAWFKLGDVEQSKEYANQILRLQPQNELAQSVIKGEFKENEDLSNVDLVEEAIGIAKISGYILQKIEGLSLENELKKQKVIKEGVFVGKEAEGRRIIEAIILIQVEASVNEGIRSNNYFVVAKLMRQILDSGEEIKEATFFNEEEYQAYVAIGTYFYGNYRLLRNDLADNFDTARYCFFEAYSMAQDIKNAYRCWALSTICYIQTYFYPKTKIRKKSGSLYYMYYNLEDRKEFDKAFQMSIEEAFQADIRTSIEEFTAGMLELTTYNSRAKNFILEKIQNHAQFGRVLDVVSGIVAETIPDTIHAEAFAQLWNKAAKVYYEMRRTFSHMLENMMDDVFSIGQLQEWYEKFNDNRYLSYLGYTDSAYIADLRKIFAALLRYNEISDFDYKAEMLGKADEARRHLEEKIREYPTALGYEALLPRLAQLQGKIITESEQLYGNAEPDISVGLSGDCSVDEENLLVSVPIAFTNKNNVQTADNVSVRIWSDNADIVQDEQLSKWLLPGNGKAEEKIFEFKVTPEVIRNKTFSVQVAIQYQYKKNMTEFQDGALETVLSIPLYSEAVFQPIENAFEPYRNGSEVKDPAMFYGREKDIEDIIRQISDASGAVLQGRCLALYGQTRTGKSSLLYHLEKRLRELDPQRNIIINIGSIGEEDLTGDDITEFLYTILDGLRHEVGSRHPRLKEMLEAAGVEIDPDRLLESQERAQLYFNNAFKGIRRVLETAQEKYNIIVMIDEFTYIYDWIRRGTMTDRIMKFWKAFIQNNGIFAVIIGQDHMMRFIEEKQFTNDFGSTDLWKVTYLTEEYAKKLMDEPIQLLDENGEAMSRYKPEALDRLYELTAGSAFLIMNLCAGLVDYLNQTHTVFVTRAHVEDYLKKNLSAFEEARFFEPQYDDKSRVDSDAANRENKRILHRIAQLSGKKEWTPLKSVIEREGDFELLEALEQRDVVIIQGRERCKIKVALYKEWIIEKYGLEVAHG
ncbi:ATP-binding protein [Selenomonas sputigena]|uniref:ATP-binding protein n=1 Tax=Selenomonas sputigena TaxID=69823 RepID=A0ABV3X528_9FIRM